MRVQNYKKIAVGWSRKRLFLNFIGFLEAGKYAFGVMFEWQ